MTTYTLFMHYYNDAIGKSVSNTTKCKWYSALTTKAEYDNEKETDKHSPYLDITDIKNHDEYKKDLETLEFIHISNKSTDTDETTTDYENYILSSIKVTNPKYDMLFIYDGLGYFNFKDEKPGTIKLTADATYTAQTQLYFDKMKRVTIRPWFFHSTYHSLKAALTKAEALIDLFGKDNILIGKEVDLTQYIEIV